MKGSHPRPADRCPFVLRHSISQVTSFMQLGMLCHIPFVPCQSSLPFLSYDFFQNLTLKFKGQGYGWGHSSKSQCGSNILSTHIPFVPCQSALPFLRYSIFKIWPWKSRVKVMGEVTIQSHNVGLTSYRLHTMDMLWEKVQWIPPLYMKPISFQSKASVVFSVTTAIFIDFCMKKLNVFSQHIGQKTNEYLNSTDQIPRNWNVDQLSMLLTS